MYVSPGVQPDLTWFQQLAAEEDGAVSGERSTASSWLPLQATWTAQISPWPKPKPADPTSRPIEELKPGRPRRLDRVQEPTLDRMALRVPLAAVATGEVEDLCRDGRERQGDVQPVDDVACRSPVLVTACRMPQHPAGAELDVGPQRQSVPGALAHAASAEPRRRPRPSLPKTGAVSRPSR